MTPAQLQTIKEIFTEALDCEPDRVNEFLDTACEGDGVLRREVEAFLTAHQQAGTFIEVPVAGLVANVIEQGQTGLLIGQTIGHYKISKRIGAGGMGEVYLASDITVGRRAALKLLPTYLTGEADRLKRFQQEARVVAGLNHPNILTVYEVGTDNSTHYIASELIEGETLRQRLARGRMQLGEAVEIAIQVAGALAVAHQASVVHRDVKPENIMLRTDGYVKVLDFGIAKLAEQEAPETMAQDEALKLVEANASATFGTVRYMSPEQARGGRLDKRTDIWSLGVVLYEMAAGRGPFMGNTPAEVMTSILSKEPSPLSSFNAKALGDLQPIITKALQKDPGQRYENANEMLEALKGLRRKLELASELERSATTHPWLRWTRSPIGVALAFLVGALALTLALFGLRNPKRPPTPEKSIAVLPFENLSEDKQDSYLGDGIQDEILSDLAKVADLKVISRTSAMQYKGGGARNLREIGRQLGVVNLVEGTVARSGNRVRVNAQLIDARTDRHLWGQAYDRELSDIFAIQNEIARTIADQLRAKLSPAEKTAIEQVPTTDVTAFDLYTRGNNLLLTGLSTVRKTDFLQAADLLNQAVTHDPSLFQAYCQLAYAHDALYFFALDHAATHLALAETAIQAASRLRPDAGETHLARARNLFWGYLDYEGALAELEVAGHSLPNDSQILELKSSIERREGHWEESIRTLDRAIKLDPRNVQMLEEIASVYDSLRRYAEEKSAYDRMLAIVPNDPVIQAERAFVEFDWKADTRPLHQIIDSIRARNPGALPSIVDDWLTCALAEHDVAAAKSALALLGENKLGGGLVQFNRQFVEGVIAKMTNDDGKARAAFTAARAEQEKAVQAQPSYAPPLCVLGLIDAALGRKEQALHEGLRAVELLPVEKDPVKGAHMIRFSAMIAAWAGDKGLACKQLATVSGHPSGPSYGGLKLLPFWDPLRGDPCFEKIVASLAPEGN